MDWLATILTSSNAVTSIVAFIIVIVLLAILSSLGLISFKGNKLSIGIADKERNIVRMQLKFVNAAIEEKFNEIKRTQTWNEWKSKCIAGQVKDVFESAIMLNHITTDSQYVLTIQSEVWAAILRNEISDPYYHSEEFSKIIKDFAKYVIENLYAIRKSC